MPGPGLVEEYLTLGLRLGRHIDGMVDAYYGPPALSRAVEAEPRVPPVRLLASARSLLADLAAGGPLDPGGVPEDSSAPARRHWIAAQVRGLAMTCAKLAGEPIAYADEVESCYGVRPSRVDEEVLVAAPPAARRGPPGHRSPGRAVHDLA